MRDPFDDPAWRDDEARWLEEPTDCAFCGRPFDRCCCTRAEASDFAMTAPASAPVWAQRLIAWGLLGGPILVAFIGWTLGWWA